MNFTKISESEWQVMNVVWERAPVTAAGIVEILTARTKWHPRTIRTLLDRLVKKGALKVMPGEKGQLYQPLISMAECMRQESRSFLERVFGGEPASMLLHLVKETKLSKDEIKELKKLLSEKEK